MPYPSKSIANFYIKKAIEENDKSLDILKLLKLIYMAHGWNLALNDKALINEPILAWQYGPVIEDVYKEFKHFGIEPINQLAVDYNVTQAGNIKVNQYEPNFDSETEALLQKVWSVCKLATGIQLSNWSHNPDGPWYKVWFDAKGYQKRSSPIANELIKEYFIKLGHANEQRQTQSH